MTPPMHNGPFEMPMYRNFIPKAIRPWIYVFFAVCFQLSGGVYLGSLNEIVGGRSLMREDIVMCLYANLAGMAIYFPLLFRMKFCFTNKTLLVTSALMIAICNMAATQVTTLPLLWFICFIAGCFKIQGTFECMSNIQLWITPKRDFTVFFPVLHIIILCSIEFSDFITAWITFHYHWYAMHWLISGLLLMNALIIMTITHHVRIMPKLPLLGIDWIGAVLWSLLALQITFIFNYGDWYDWYNSPVIKLVTGAAFITLALCIHRMLRIRHPFLEPEMWTYKNLLPILILIAVVEAFLATQHILEEIFYEDGMEYSSLTSAWLNWGAIVGVILGALFSLLWLKVCRFNYYKLLAIGMAALAGYLACYHFLIARHINIEVLFFPTILRGFSYCVLSATFMVCLHEIMTFRHFFQALSVFNMMHMLIGGVIGAAFYATGMRFHMADNIARYAGYIDSVAASKEHLVLSEYMHDFIINMEMISVKQIYGWVLYACILIFLLFLLYDRPYVRSTLKHIPNWRTVGRSVKNAVFRLRPASTGSSTDDYDDEIE